MNNERVMWGASGLSHDAAISVIKDGRVVFASSSERYSRVKNDKNFSAGLISECLKFGSPDIIVWYENPFKKFLRRLLIDKRFKPYNVKEVFRDYGIYAKVVYVDHHFSHLCGSVYTCPWDSLNKTLGLVVDSVGEFKTLTVWDINNGKYFPIHSLNYPNSLGLFYSSITDMLGMKAQEEEYIMMGMASYGGCNSDKYYTFFKDNLFDQNGNLVVDLRKGCKHLLSNEEIEDNKFDIASAAQRIYEENVVGIAKQYLGKTGYKKLLLSGGCALNCTANSKLLELVNDMWIFPNPGDSGSSLGAALSYYGKKIELNDMYLGHDAKSKVDINDLVSCINENGMAGVVYGKSEFGPRAFGHRSILADPRVPNIKDIVNGVKGRENFRPFAPIILEPHFERNFVNVGKGITYPYMQFTFKCKHSDKYPGIVHVDGSSRVQTVNESTPFIYQILTKWYELTGCPILLNTSLNIKGKPLLNSLDDISEFNGKNIKIYGQH